MILFSADWHGTAAAVKSFKGVVTVSNIVDIFTVNNLVRKCRSRVTEDSEAVFWREVIPDIFF
jgi:hypothetical protein